MHAAHHYFGGPLVLIPIAMFRAPLVSVTTITVMLLIGAFRRFKDDDMDKINIQSLAAEAVKLTQGASPAVLGVLASNEIHLW
ncbi:hypothetical protein C8J32_11036 [Rhizobium sp. PP-CC-3A-592]|nr:hypothetical protein C8J32_11036 [Rhizobium sp. PP-CC-3A-592]